MSVYYMQHDLDRMREKRQQGFYLVKMERLDIRVEVNLAYQACLNTLLDKAHFNSIGEAYLTMREMSDMQKKLAVIANKPVTEEKMRHYIAELQDLNLIDEKEQGYYLKRII